MSIEQLLAQKYLNGEIEFDDISLDISEELEAFAGVSNEDLREKVSTWGERGTWLESRWDIVNKIARADKAEDPDHKIERSVWSSLMDSSYKHLIAHDIESGFVIREEVVGSDKFYKLMSSLPLETFDRIVELAPREDNK